MKHKPRILMARKLGKKSAKNFLKTREGTFSNLYPSLTEWELFEDKMGAFLVPEMEAYLTEYENTLEKTDRYQP